MENQLSKMGVWLSDPIRSSNCEPFHHDHQFESRRVNRKHAELPNREGQVRKRGLFFTKRTLLLDEKLWDVEKSKGPLRREHRFTKARNRGFACLLL